MRKAIGLAVGILIFSSAAASADVVVRQAQLSAVTGNVEWQKAGTADWKAAGLNQKLEPGDKIRTDEAAEAVVTLDDGSTLQLFPGSEFTIQTLTKDSATEQMESVLALMKGKLRGDVTAQKEGSKFEFETPILVAAIRGTIPHITIHPDNSVTVFDEDGIIDLLREGDLKFIARLETGEEALVEYDPVSGTIKITCVKGVFEVTDADGTVHTLSPGDTLIVTAGGATFIPNPSGPNAPPGDSFDEPTGALEALEEPASGV